MRASACGAIALWITMIGCAGAQQQPAADPGQQQRHDDMLQTVPGKNGKEEPSSHAPTTSTSVFVNGALAVPGAPADSQTVPAKYSQRNAALDAVPIMAIPPALSDAQKKSIYDSVMKAGAPVATIDAKPAQELPDAVDMHELPSDVTATSVRGLKYVRLPDSVLLVSPSNRIVVGRISK